MSKALEINCCLALPSASAGSLGHEENWPGLLGFGQLNCETTQFKLKHSLEIWGLVLVFVLIFFSQIDTVSNLGKKKKGRFLLKGSF